MNFLAGLLSAAGAEWGGARICALTSMCTLCLLLAPRRRMLLEGGSAGRRHLLHTYFQVSPGACTFSVFLFSLKLLNSVLPL